MVLNNIRDAIGEVCDSALLFDNPSFDNSIIGVSTDGCVIYDFRKMVEEFSNENECDEQSAIDFIEYDTIHSLNYLEGNKPIILDDDIVRMEVENI